MSTLKPTGLKLRGETWHIDKIYRGIRIRGSCETSSLNIATEVLEIEKEKVRKAQLFGVRPQHTFLEAATYYLKTKKKRSLAKDAWHLEIIEPFIGKLFLEDIHDATLRPFIEHRYSTHVKPKSINCALEVVRHILNLAAGKWRDKDGKTWLLQAPMISMEDIGDTAAKPYPLSWKEQDNLFSHLTRDLAEACQFKVNTGLRDEEVCHLRWDWEHEVVGHNISVFIIPGGRVKNAEDRLVVLNNIAKQIVDKRRDNGSEWVFPSTKTNKPRFNLNNSSWKTAWRAAGLPVSPKWTRGVHNLKHTFGRRLRAAGVEFEDRQVLLGHTNGSITTHYSGPEILNLIEAANSVCSSRPEAVLRRVV
ncbi:site-specific integrase [Dasania marina]|uniref:tyrosine-type recombinase/integrase n=1 Tax=Dasania marina TaxID=471499 RepID=UPI0030DBB57D|tara:strand:- start:65344 stop:66429 length:1086 start_codon:yes stop_codon:yes gene_type:complete